MGDGQEVVMWKGMERKRGLGGKLSADGNRVRVSPLASQHEKGGGDCVTSKRNGTCTPAQKMNLLFS